MKRIMICLVVAAIVMGVSYAAYAGAEEDAKALAQREAVFIKQNGRDAGIAEIMKPNGEFKKDDLFLTLIDLEGVVVANAAVPQLVGANIKEMKDVRQSIEIAKTKGGGWLEYSFTDQNAEKIAPRKAWVQKVEGTDLFVLATPVTWH